MNLVYEFTGSDTPDTTILGLLPIFGAPEQNPFSPGISYGVIPEPSSFAMVALGSIGLLGAARRRSFRVA